MSMQTQEELEREMVQRGQETALNAYEKNEQHSRASANPYAASVYRRFVIPLSEVIAAKYAETGHGPSRRNTITRLLDGADADVLAFLAVKTCLNTLVGEVELNATDLGKRIGNLVYGEVILREFEEIEPALFNVLVADLKGRMSKSERHRLNVFRNQAEKAGVVLTDWSTSDRVLVGLALLHELTDLGLLTTSIRAVKGKSEKFVSLDPGIFDILDHIKNFVSLTMPQVMPCVERPMPWTDPMAGGWHTNEMRRTAPSCITGRPMVSDYDVPQEVLADLNALQDTEWQINTALLETVKVVAKHFDVGEVLCQAELPKPQQPFWLIPGMDKGDMTEEQLHEFVQWKRSVAIWHTEKKIRGTHWGRYYEALRVANKFKDCDCLWFVYQLDYRGRAYAQSRGVSPQGSDLQKSLIRFRKGAKVVTGSAIRWFKINGANRFGYDKATLEDRVAWVDRNTGSICRMAADPISFRDWTEADKPFQFLAWCFEYAAWLEHGDNFRTHLAVGLDGSCNGLQHFSAMMRDEVGGEATNLMDNKEQQDIYGIVAIVTEGLLHREEDCDMKRRWLAHGITRKLCKRSVMTLPYGSTRFSCSDFILKDYLQAGLAPEFSKDEYTKAAIWLSHRMWEAIKQVVIKGREAMDWLQKGAGALTRAGATDICWRTPNGFVVRQRYNEAEVRRVMSRISGGVRIQVRVGEYQEDTPDVRRHANGIAPNFVHSLDAAHMQRCIRAAKQRGINSLMMIHDDYGTTADLTQELYELIREEFVKMYTETDPLVDFAEAHGDIVGEPPEKGSLDLAQVLNSTYFFC